MKFTGLMMTVLMPAVSAQHKPGYCNVCRETPSGQADRYLTKPSQSFQMNGETWTCGYLQSTVQDVDPFHGAAGEARFCSLTQIIAEQKCSCGGPKIPPTTDNIIDPNPACDICKGQALPFVPALNSKLVADTKILGKQNCAGLYNAAAKGVVSDRNCPIVQANAGPICCNVAIPSSANDYANDDANEYANVEANDDANNDVAECPASRTYAQCGGFTYNGETCCPDGWGCAYVSAEYSQCTMCSEAYGQCGGGPGYNGSTCCTSGFKCTAHGDYYKGCDEDKVPPCTNNLFDTCGGKGWQGEKCCSAGSECRATGPYHAMCQSCATEAYAKCGGKGHNGPTCCTAGFKCVSHGPYHSQCEPATIV